MKVVLAIRRPASSAFSLEQTSEEHLPARLPFHSYIAVAVVGESVLKVWEAQSYVA